MDAQPNRESRESDSANSGASATRRVSQLWLLVVGVVLAGVLVPYTGPDALALFGTGMALIALWRLTE